MDRHYNLLDKVPPLPPYEKIPEVPGGPVREYGKRVLEKGDSEKKKPSPFFRLGSGVGLVEYKKSVDKIAESRPLDPELQRTLTHLLIQ